MGICNGCIRDTYEFSRKDTSVVSPSRGPSLTKPVEKFDTLGRKSRSPATKKQRQTEDDDIQQQVAAKIRAASILTGTLSSASAISDKTCDTISNKSTHSFDSQNLSVQLSFDRTEDDGTVSGKHSTIGELPNIKRSREKEYVSSRLSWRNSLTEDECDSLCSNQSIDLLHWKRGNKLGSGSFGTVYLGLTDMGELIAVKQIDISACDFKEAEKEYHKIYREVNILKNLKHQNIVQYFGSCLEEDQIMIFTEYVSGGSLASIIQRFGPLEEHITARYTKQLLDAISYMHENNVVHRDIKSANIMLMPQGIIKLIDFGCARKLVLRLSKSGSMLMKSLKGTPYWMAPEVINESGHGKKSDIWSLGCTVFEMLTGKPPWGDREPFAAIYAIGSEDIPMPELPETFCAKARDFVHACLTRDKRKRPTALKLKSYAFVNHVPETQSSYESGVTDDSKWVEKKYHL